MKRALPGVVLAFVAAGGVAGCGGSAKSGGASKTAAEPATGPATPAIDPTIDTKGTTKPEINPQKKGEGALQPIEVRAAKEQAVFDEASTAFAAAGSDCAQLCKALGSMTRSTLHLCELAKQSGDDKRCTDATGKLESARAKVKSSCGGCE